MQYCCGHHLESSNSLLLSSCLFGWGRAWKELKTNPLGLFMFILQTFEQTVVYQITGGGRERSENAASAQLPRKKQTHTGTFSPPKPAASPDGSRCCHVGLA